MASCDPTFEEADPNAYRRPYTIVYLKPVDHLQERCKFDGTPAGCRYGSECRYAHCKPCRFFNTPGGCEKGVGCFFKHCKPQ